MRVGSPDNTVAPSAAKPASSKRLLEWSWAADDDTPIAKLCDLGVSRAKLGTTHMTRVGTPQWASPEILRDEPYNEKTDIFSFGIVWWECLTRKKPFVSMSPMRVISAVSMDHLRLPLPGDVPRPLAALVKHMWNSTPTKRPSATEVLYQLRDFEQQ
jgi:serine/threonine protein kinase